MNPNGTSTPLDNKTDESGYERSATRATRIGPPPRAKPQQRMTIDEAWKARAAKYLGKKPTFTGPPPEWAILHEGPSLGKGVPIPDSPGWTQRDGDDARKYGGDNNTMGRSSVFLEFQKRPQAAAAAAAAAPTNAVAATAGAATPGAATAVAATPCDDNKLLPNGYLDLRQVLTNPGYTYTQEEINDQTKKLFKAAQEGYYVPQNQADYDLPKKSRT
jgi:hypothetical protein